MRHKLFYFAQAAALALMAGQAYAQAPADGARGTVEEVVVTATKRATPLQTTPIAVTAVSSTLLEQEHVKTIADVTKLVPSFQATTEGDHGVITLTLRGIGNDSAKTEYADPEVAMFVDGVYTPRAEGASALLMDLDSIEVLRGPQGTLWGRNSTAGAVNMVTVKPTTDDYYGYGQIGTGSYGRIMARGAVNLPINDRFAMRIAFAHEQHDGYVDYQNPDTQIPSLADQMAAATAAGIAPADFRPINTNLFIQKGDKYNSQDQSAIRLSTLVRPNDRISWNASFEYFRDRGTPSINLMQDPRPGQDFWSSLVDVAPYLHRDVYTFRSRLDFDINEHVAFNYVTGYSWFDGSSDFDQDGGAHVPTSFATGATYQEDRTNSSHYFNYSHEVELKSQGQNRLDWILGAYYAAEDNRIRFDIPIFNGTQEGTVGWQGSFIQPKETVRTEAVFGQAILNVSDDVHLTGGVRYTKDHRTNVGGTNNAWAYNAACPQIPLDPGTNPLNSPCFTTYQHNDGVYDNDKVTWLVRGDATLAPGQFVYASVSTGYKSGGLQDGGLPYDPETLTNYEVGTKHVLFGGLATWNNALFYETFKGFQLAAPVTFSDGSHGLAFSNAGGTTKVYGFESELTVRPSPDDLLQASVSFLHTKLGVLRAAGSNDYANLPPCAADPRISNCLDVTGNSLAHSPDFSGTLIYQHDFHIGADATITPRISTHYETSSWLSVFHDGPGDKQKAYHRTDLSLIYSSGGERPWTIEAFVQNVEDSKVRTNAGVTADNIYTSQYLPPRTYGVNLGYKF